ncbi:MAG: hypothetical protein ACWA44_02730 [Thiotrichales bacterium]
MISAAAVHERREIYLRGIEEPKLEYELQLAISRYLKMYYPRVEFRVDMAGNNLSKAQAGKAKAVNKRRAWPDLEIYDPSGEYFGLCLELKVFGTKIRRKENARKKLQIGTKMWKKRKIKIYENFRRLTGMYWDLHIQEQGEQMERLRKRGRIAGFAVGLRAALTAIDYYFEQPEMAIDYLEL